jgi:3-oxochol-4-en-24-oyl-CoA dehydrogenase
MPLGLTDDQQALADALADWARDAATTEVVKAAEGQDADAFAEVWDGLTKLGVVSIAVPEDHGGAGGSFLDLACAVEACAAAMVPGPVLSTAVAATLLAEHAERSGVPELLAAVADGTCRVAVTFGPSDLTVAEGVSGEVAVLGDGAGATHLLVGTVDRWVVVDASASGVTVEPGESADLSRRAASVRLVDVPPVAEVPLTAERVRAVALALAAAEGAGIARWSLATAVDYAKVRQQFGKPIGSFQAIKHLCAQMLERSESATAVAWDAAAAYDEELGQLTFAAEVAGAVALDAAVTNAQDCIQVLGGIGFTWEHDAHLYLRRAMTNRLLLGGTDASRLALADAAMRGARRATHVDLGDEADRFRQASRDLVSQVASAEGPERRRAFADTGLLTPHWPEPYGLGAGALQQIVIDDELRKAGVDRPDLIIGAWAAPTILEHGTDEQRHRFVDATLRDEITWCQLFSEPGAGSDLASLRTKAERVDGGWRLTGQKVWTSLAQEADWAICLARTNPDAKPHRGITYFLLDMTSDGIDIRPLREMTGDALFNEVFLDGVFVPDDCVVGEVDNGWKLARTTLANERVAMSGSSLGVSLERALAALPDDAGEGVRLRVGAAVAEATTLKTLGLRSTMRSLAGQGPGPESSVRKLVGVRQRQDSSELALEILGERAVLGDQTAQAAWHEALTTRCLSIAGGTTQVLRNVAAERILGLPRG